jgi:hypothetical protein
MFNLVDLSYSGILSGKPILATGFSPLCGEYGCNRKASTRFKCGRRSLISPISTKHLGRPLKIQEFIQGTNCPEIQHLFLINTVFTVFILNAFLIK